MSREAELAAARSAGAQLLRELKQKLFESADDAKDGRRFEDWSRLHLAQLRVGNMAAQLEPRKDRFPHLDRAYEGAWTRITRPPQNTCPKRPQRFARPVRFVRPTPRECRPARRRGRLAQHRPDHPPTLTYPYYAGCRHDRRPVPGRVVQQQPRAPAKADRPRGRGLRVGRHCRAVGGGFRLTSTAAEYGPAFGFIKETNVPLVPGDDDGLTHFPQGPQKARVAA